MSFVPENKRNLILDLCNKRIPIDQFLKDFNASEENIRIKVASMLEQAIREEDSQAVEFGLMLMYKLLLRQNRNRDND